VRDGAVQAYDALTVNLLNILDATSSVTLGGTLAATTTIDINSGGTIVQNGAITSASTVDLDAISTIGLNAAISGVSGILDVDAGGTTTIGALADISTGGAVTFGALKTGSLTTSGDVVTTDDNITFTRGVTLGGNVDIDTGGAVLGNILFSSTIATAGNNLALDAGTAGNITLGALSGGGDLTVRDGAVQSYDALTVNLLDILDATTSVTLGGSVAATTTIDIDSGGTIVQDGAITLASNIDLDAASTIDLNAAISGVSGTLDIDAGGTTTIGALADISTGDAVTFGATKTGGLTTSGDIVTTDDNITFTRAVTLGGNVDIDTGGVALDAGLIAGAHVAAGTVVHELGTIVVRAAAAAGLDTGFGLVVTVGVDPGPRAVFMGGASPAAAQTAGPAADGVAVVTDGVATAAVAVHRSEIDVGVGFRVPPGGAGIAAACPGQPGREIGVAAHPEQAVAGTAAGLEAVRRRKDGPVVGGAVP
jgi:hypothetical protein